MGKWGKAKQLSRAYYKANGCQVGFFDESVHPATQQWNTAVELISPYYGSHTTGWSTNAAHLTSTLDAIRGYLRANKALAIQLAKNTEPCTDVYHYASIIGTTDHELLIADPYGENANVLLTDPDIVTTRKPASTT